MWLSDPVRRCQSCRNSGICKTLLFAHLSGFKLFSKTLRGPIFASEKYQGCLRNSLTVEVL